MLIRPTTRHSRPISPSRRVSATCRPSQIRPRRGRTSISASTRATISIAPSTWFPSLPIPPVIRSGPSVSLRSYSGACASRNSRRTLWASSRPRHGSSRRTGTRASPSRCSAGGTSRIALAKPVTTGRSCLSRRWNTSSRLPIRQRAIRRSSWAAVDRPAGLASQGVVDRAQRELQPVGSERHAEGWLALLTNCP
jgi:hypothetical protein